MHARRPSVVTTSRCYTYRMKTANSVPDDASGRTPDAITDSLNDVLADVGRSTDPFVARATERILKNSEW